MSRARRIGTQLLLWAGPLGVGLALLVLLSQASAFRAGPETPSAGDARAWGAIWAALVLVGVGCVLGAVASLAWLFEAWRRRHRPSALDWFRSGLNLAMAIGACWLWFRS